MHNVLSDSFCLKLRVVDSYYHLASQDVCFQKFRLAGLYFDSFETGWIICSARWAAVVTKSIWKIRMLKSLLTVNARPIYAMWAQDKGNGEECRSLALWAVREPTIAIRDFVLSCCIRHGASSTLPPKRTCLCSWLVIGWVALLQLTQNPILHSANFWINDDALVSITDVRSTVGRTRLLMGEVTVSVCHRPPGNLAFQQPSFLRSW